MRMRVKSSCVVLWVLPALSIGACGGATWELDLNVRVTAAVQESYSGGYPAQLVMLLDTAPPTDPSSTGGRTYRIANLCAVGSESLVFNARLSGTDCNAPQYVRAWLEPRDADAESKCGSISPPTELDGLRKTPTASPRAEGSPFPDACSAEGQPLTLALSFKRTP